MTTSDTGGGRSWSLVGWVETVAAPLGAVAALLLFFGWTRSRAYFGYFGVDQGVLQYAPQEHILRSADSMFGTIVLLLAGMVAFVALERVVARWGALDRPGRISRLVRAGVRAVAVWAGPALLVAGLLLALGTELPWVDLPPIVGALLLAAGAIIMLRVGIGRLPVTAAAPRLARALLGVALFLATFWVAALYAQTSGERLARETDEAPVGLPLVTVFSETYLDVPGSSVTPTPVPDADGTVRYRYTGLRLLAYSNERWFLLTGRYAEFYRHSALVLRDDEHIRIEVARQR